MPKPIPLLIAISFAVSLAWLYLDLLNFVRDKKATKSRANILDYLSSQKLGISDKSKREIHKIEEQIKRVGDVVVQKRYRRALEELISQTGGKGENFIGTLIKQKIYFAIIGSVISLLLILNRDWILLPLTLIFTFIMYQVPNLFVLLGRLVNSSYGKRLIEFAALSGLKKINSEKLVFLKFSMALISFVLSYLYIVLNSRSLSSLAFGIAAVVVSFFLPDLLLYNKVIKRRNKFEEELPDAIDLLSMCVSSGLAFPAAIVKVAESQEGPVAEEFSRMNLEVQLGKDRNEALSEMSKRIKVKSLEQFVNSVAQVDRFGIPISRALKEQTREMRAERRSRGREKAQKVPVKILGPVMICFLPCVLMIVLAPAIIGIFANL